MSLMLYKDFRSGTSPLPGTAQPERDERIFEEMWARERRRRQEERIATLENRVADLEDDLDSALRPMERIGFRAHD